MANLQTGPERFSSCASARSAPYSRSNSAPPFSPHFLFLRNLLSETVANLAMITTLLAPPQILTSASTQSFLYSSLLFTSFDFTSLLFTSTLSFSRLPLLLRLPDYSCLSFMWAIMNSRNMAVLHAPRSCHQSHCEAPMIRNISCVPSAGTHCMYVADLHRLQNYWSSDVLWCCAWVNIWE